MSVKTLYEQKLALLKQIKEITIKMTSTVQSIEIEELEVMIREKQKVIDTIDEIDKTISSNYDISDTMNDELSDIRKEILFVIEDIITIDNELKAATKEAHAGIVNNIKRLGKTKKAFKTYAGKPAQVRGLFLEKKK